MTDERPWRRFRTVFQRDVRSDVDDELAFHLDMRAQELIEQGIGPAQARREAEHRFGDRVPVERECIEIDRRVRQREHRAEALMDAIQDVRYALRMLRRAPGFAAVAVLTLALGIGATTAIYSVVDAVMFKALPYPAAERLVVPLGTRRGAQDRMFSGWRDFDMWQTSHVFESVALYQQPELDLTGECGGSGPCEPMRASVAIVTRDFFKVLGVRPALGRFPQPDEFKPGTERPLIISYALWQSRYGGARDVVGRKVRMTGIPVTIVGVMPKNAEWPRDADMWYPNRSTPNEGTLAPDNFMFRAIARLAPSSTIEQTHAKLAQLARTVEEQFPAKRTGITIVTEPLREFMVGAQLTRALWVLFGAVAFVLVIACVNIANLLLARAATREREMALRTALGAERHRLVRQLLTESFVLAAAGGLLGALLAVWLGPVLTRMSAEGALQSIEVGLSLPVLGVAAASTLLAATIFGLAPAVRASRAQPAQALAERGGRAGGSRRQRRAAATLVIAEVALSLTLLAGAGLLGKSLIKLRGVDTGMDTRRVLTFQITLPQNRYNSRVQFLRFWDDYLGRVRGLPGVTAASLTTALPFGGGGFYLGRTMIEAGAPEPPAGTEVGIMWNEVETDYFKVLGHPVLAGREFSERDDTAATPAIIVTRRFVDAMFPGKPLGETLGRRVFSWRDERVAREIVGVVGDIRYEGAADTIKPIVYIPARQDALGAGVVLVRTTGDASGLAAAARRELASIDPSIALAHVKTMDEVLAESIGQRKTVTTLLGAFAALAVLLAAIGLYGLLSYGVARETREIGVRMALGASPRGVMLTVLRRSLGLASLGAVLGLIGAVAVTRVLGSLLFDVHPTDAGTLAGVTGLLLAIAALASWIPARRATRVDPVVALRSE
jgi:putative ABC transport system permease protein